jgi:hypothetical protein
MTGGLIFFLEECHSSSIRIFRAYYVSDLSEIIDACILNR